METEDLLGGRYRLEHVAGHGGMAVVYEAFDTILERRVAIKYFQTHLLHEPVLVERFRREALAAAKIGVKTKFVEREEAHTDAS